MTTSTQPAEAPAGTKYAFQADVSEVLKLVIHSLYSHREIFLRELISNASDALDKLRFRALTEPQLLEQEPALEIRLRADEGKATLSIEDTGIGMTREELVRDLGTVAHSGSRAFLELASAKPEAKKDLNLIGQFGVGFYSSFLVADRVEVISRAAGSDEAFRWSSDAHESFTVEPADRAARGTEVILHFRDEHKELLERWKLRELVQRYSDFVSWPIKIAGPEKKEGEEKKDGGELPAWEQVNRASALWRRPKSEITDEQYNELYRHLSHDFEPPLARSHFRVEGAHEFVGLVYLPTHAPFDLSDPKRKRGVRLFVRRVFIMDECEELVPSWLRFVRGLVDSDDLPLNVSRELLQDSRALATIKKQIIKHTLDLLDEVAKDKPDDYEAFWKTCGVVLKEGLAIEPGDHKERLGRLARWESSATEPGKVTSLDAYVERAKAAGSGAAPVQPEQKEIYYLIGESRKALEGSPHIEALRSRGTEILFMTDPVDEWAAQGLGEFSGKRLVNAMRADVEPAQAEDDKKKKEEQAGALAPLVERIQSVLKDKVREVKVTARLTDSPCCLALGFGASSPFLERLLKERRMGMPQAKRILEINGSHPLITNLGALLAREPTSAKIDEWIMVMYEQALLAEGSAVEDAAAFARRVASLLTQVSSEEPPSGTA